MTLVQDVPGVERPDLTHQGTDARALVGRVMGSAAAILALYGVVVLILIGRVDHVVSDYVGATAVWVVGFGLVTVLAIPNQPRNKAVWLVAVAALSAGLGVAGWGTAILAAHRSGLPTSFQGGWYELTPLEVPAISALAWMVAFVGILGGVFLVLTLGLLLFPDGRFSSTGWRWVGWSSALLTPVTALAMAWEWRPTSTLRYGAPSSDFESIGRLADVSMPALLLLAGISVASIVVGYRRSFGATRQQHKWIALGGGIFLALIATMTLSGPMVPEGTDTEWRLLAFVAGAVILIGSYGVAITRYRLYDVDLVINRAVVFALLAGFITIVYSLIVVGLGRLIGRGEGLILPVVATAVVAVAFEPMRQRAQRWANRVVYGRKATPYEVLSDLTARLAESEEGQGILVRMAKLLHDGTGAVRVTVWLGSPGSMIASAIWPTEASAQSQADLDADGVFPVFHDGEVVGALEVVKPRGTVLSSQERSLINDVAGSAGLVFGYQRLNESLQRRAEEVRASRSRLVGIQDDERRRIEKELHDGVQQSILALKVKIGVAARLAERHEAEAELESLLSALGDEAQMALDEVRLLARGIYPPVLVSDGLGAAVSALAASAPVEVSFQQQDVGRYPVEVEAAVYFGISEAVTNAIKHAHPPLKVDVTKGEGVLRFAVSDQGPGFDVGTAQGGSGLQNLRDRIEAVGGELEIIAAPGEGTVIRGLVSV